MSIASLRNYQLRKQAERKSQGLCIRCGLHKVESNMQCPDCLERERKKYRKTAILWKKNKVSDENKN